MNPSVIFNKLPRDTVISGKRYPINYGYRAMMMIEMEMFGENNDSQKLLNALNIFYFRDIPAEWQEAVDYMIWFYKCGEERKKAIQSNRKAKRGYSFEKDDFIIYAAFRQQYGINLRETKNADMHWWEFCAMFECLDENTKLAKVIYWRTCDLRNLPAKQREFVKRMRKTYRLEEPESTVDSKMKLAKRNADIMEYVRKRMSECGK